MHNSRYWDRTPYLGVGAAAHSFNGTQRRWNIADVKRYVATFEHESETLSPTDAYNEYLMTALRTVEGIDKQLVDIRFRDVLERKINRFVQAGLIDDTPPIISLLPPVFCRPTASLQIYSSALAPLFGVGGNCLILISREEYTRRLRSCRCWLP